MLKGILVKPNEMPEVIEFEKGYKEMQRLVEGNFEMPALFPDVDVVINEDGKFNGSLANRFLYYQGELVDIIFGNILITDADSEGETISLSKPKINKYMQIFSSYHIYLE